MGKLLMKLNYIKNLPRKVKRNIMCQFLFEGIHACNKRSVGEVKISPIFRVYLCKEHYKIFTS